LTLLRLCRRPLAHVPTDFLRTSNVRGRLRLSIRCHTVQFDVVVGSVPKPPLRICLEGVECHPSWTTAPVEAGSRAANAEVRFVFVRSRENVHGVLLSVHERN